MGAKDTMLWDYSAPHTIGRFGAAPLETLAGFSADSNKQFLNS